MLAECDPRSQMFGGQLGIAAKELAGARDLREQHRVVAHALGPPGKIWRKSQDHLLDSLQFAGVVQKIASDEPFGQAAIAGLRSADDGALQGALRLATLDFTADQPFDCVPPAVVAPPPAGAPQRCGGHAGENGTLEREGTRGDGGRSAHSSRDAEHMLHEWERPSGPMRDRTQQQRAHAAADGAKDEYRHADQEPAR